MTAVTEGLEEEIPISGRLYFTDSRVALFWIRGTEKSWKPFVQNQVAEIRALTSVECWSHCPGIQNPADILSRGVTPQDLSRNELWSKGPSLVEPDQLQEEDSDMPDECSEELTASEKQKTHNLLTTNVLDVCALLRCDDFSSLNRLISVATLVLKFCSLLRSKANPEKHTWFEADERKVAEQLLIKSAQTSLATHRNFE
jgi:hypothetical protein